MMWPDMMSPWNGEPGPKPRLALGERMLSALAEAAITRRTAIGFCADCPSDGRFCPDHKQDLAEARQYEADYAQVSAWIPGWAELISELTGALN